MAINFPSNPLENDEYTENGLTYIFTGTKWKRISSAISYIDSDANNIATAIKSYILEPIGKSDEDDW